MTKSEWARGPGSDLHCFGFREFIRHSSFARRLDPELAQQKRPALGGFLDDLAGRFAGAVTGARFDPNQDWSGACLRGLERRGVFKTVRRQTDQQDHRGNRPALGVFGARTQDQAARGMTNDE